MRAARAPARRGKSKSRGTVDVLASRLARLCTRAAPALRSIAPIGPEPPLLDHLGLVPRWDGLALEQVDTRLVPLVSAATSAVTAVVRSEAPSRLLACYLRGSLPRGLFLEGVSDVDLIALVASDDPEGAAERIERAAARSLDDDDDAATAATADGRALVTKIEVRVHCLPLEGAAALQKVVELREQIPPSLVRRLMPRSLAFELATSAVGVPCAGGAADLLDLPSLLPDVARLPPAPWLLPTIAADVRRAVDAARSAGTSTAAASAAAVRWALKRSIRASLELQFLSRRAAARSNRPGLRWTRDLFYCAALTRAAADSGACRLSARVAGAVDEALELYVSLLGEGGSTSVAAASDHAERLADALDAAFLAAMLSEEPGWLTRHAPPPPPGRRRSRSWWPFGAADQPTQHHPDDAIASQPPLVLVGCEPPPVHVRISGPPRLQFDAAAANNAAAATALASALTSAKSMASLAAEPVLLRGLAANWPAVAGGACCSWSFSQLVGDNDLRGKARAAPSLAFPFCEPALRDVLVVARGAEAAPSLEVDVAASEFVRAMLLMRRPSPLDAASPPPAALAGLPRAWARSSDCTTPYLYLQAVLPEGHAMHDAVKGGLDQLLALLRSAAPDACVAQSPRLWASVRGAVSPTHYDRDASLLVQIVGHKRMLLFSPDQLECLRPYPEQHLLRRRARVNLASAPEEDGEGLRSRLCAIEVILEPGDAIFFPPEWAHYTESLSPSMSVTTRFALRRGSS